MNRNFFSLIYIILQVGIGYNILGYHFNLPLVNKIYYDVNLYMPEDVVSILFIIITIILLFVFFWFKISGYNYKEHYHLFYIFSLLISLNGYENIWFTQNFLISCILWFIGFTGTLYVYLRGR